MKILVVCQYYYPEEFQINAICEGLVERGHDVRLQRLTLHVRNFVDHTACPVDTFNPLGLVQTDDVNLGPVGQVDLEFGLARLLGVHTRQRQRLEVVPPDLLGLVVRGRGCEEVRLLTSPANTLSIAFHTHMGFTIEPGDTLAGTVSVHSDYDGPGEDRVLFVKRIAP